MKYLTLISIIIISFQLADKFNPYPTYDEINNNDQKEHSFNKSIDINKMNDFYDNIKFKQVDDSENMTNNNKTREGFLKAWGKKSFNNIAFKQKTGMDMEMGEGEGNFIDQSGNKVEQRKPSPLVSSNYNMIPWIKWDKAVHKPKKVRGWVGTVAELVDEKVMDLAEHEKRSTITTCDQIKAGYGFYVANDQNICGRLPAQFVANMYSISMFSNRNPDTLLIQIELGRIAGKVLRVPGAPECFYISSHAEVKKIFGCFKSGEEMETWFKVLEQFEKCRFGDDLQGTDKRLLYIKKNLPAEQIQKMQVTE